MKIVGAVAVASAALAAAATPAAPPITITLVASTSAVDYGKPVTLSGTISSQKANQSVAIEATECGTTRVTKAATFKTAANGAYTGPVTPALATSYQATIRASKSAAVTIAVRPLLQLTRVARGSFTAKTTAGRSLKGKTVLFQRYSRLRKRWVQVKKVVLTTDVPNSPRPAIVTTASFRSRVAVRTRVRLFISKAQAAPCYASAASAAIRA